jgi:hypothetical protein
MFRHLRATDADTDTDAGATDGAVMATALECLAEVVSALGTRVGASVSRGVGDTTARYERRRWGRPCVHRRQPRLCDDVHCCCQLRYSSRVVVTAGSLYVALYDQ